MKTLLAEAVADGRPKRRPSTPFGGKDGTPQPARVSSAGRRSRPSQWWGYSTEVSSAERPGAVAVRTTEDRVQPSAMPECCGLHHAMPPPGAGAGCPVVNTFHRPPHRRRSLGRTAPERPRAQMSVHHDNFVSAGYCLSALWPTWTLRSASWGGATTTGSGRGCGIGDHRRITSVHTNDSFPCHRQIDKLASTYHR